MQYSVNDHLYNEGMRVIVYSFLLKDENTGYELNLDIWDYFIDRVEDDDYIYQYTEYRTEINGLDIYSLVSKKYKMHEITKESLNIRLVFEENNNEPPVKRKDFKCGKTVNSCPSLLTISLGHLYLYYRVDNINGVTYEQNRANTETI